MVGAFKMNMHGIAWVDSITLFVQANQVNGHVWKATPCVSSPLKAELNLFKHHCVPKIKLTLPIVQIFPNYQGMGHL